MQEIHEMQVHPWVRKIPWRSKRQPTPVWAIVQRITKSGTQLKDWAHHSLRCLKSKYWYWGFFSFLVLILTSFCRSYCYDFFVVCFFEEWTVCVCTKLLQSCLTLCDPMDYSLPGSSVHGITQARILEWVVLPSSRGSSQFRDWTHVSYVSCTGRWVLYH